MWPTQLFNIIHHLSGHPGPRWPKLIWNMRSWNSTNHIWVLWTSSYYKLWTNIYYSQLMICSPTTSGTQHITTINQWLHANIGSWHAEPVKYYNFFMNQFNIWNIYFNFITFTSGIQHGTLQYFNHIWQHQYLDWHKLDQV